VWQVMRRNPHIRQGLERAGFTGGWLAKSSSGATAASTATATASVQ
jgi:hypothetical protein